LVMASEMVDAVLIDTSLAAPERRPTRGTKAARATGVMKLRENIVGRLDLKVLFL
jgi:hypothetical protein